MQIADRGYIRPEVLVSTDWVQEKIGSPEVRIVESNEDQLLYSSGHVPGAVEIDWIRDLNHAVVRDYLDGQSFSELMGRGGITPETTVVLYGDKSNWWATYAFWIFKLFGHRDVRIMDGGRLKWEQEGRDLTKEKPSFERTSYPVVQRYDKTVRVFRDGVLEHTQAGLPLVDVRSPEEYRGERLHMEGYPNEGALRGGHIPGAVNIPWARAINPDDSTFKGAAELREIYEQDAGLRSDQEIVAYCRIGERSSHTWFVLSYLLGYERVRNYDGSWTEWGNLVGAPIER